MLPDGWDLIFLTFEPKVEIILFYFTIESASSLEGQLLLPESGLLNQKVILSSGESVFFDRESQRLYVFHQSEISILAIHYMMCLPV